MDRETEIEERLGRVQTLRVERGRLRTQVKNLNADRKDVEERLDALLDEIKEIRDGGGVQETLTTTERGAVREVKKLHAALKNAGADMTFTDSEGRKTTIGAKPKGK